MRGRFQRSFADQQVSSFRVCLVITILGLSLAGFGDGTMYAALAAPMAVSLTYTVNSTADAPDVDTGDSICAAVGGACTLRAAIMQANPQIVPVTIILPAGTYQLTRVGYDDNAFAGDLDISAGKLTIQGAGSGKTIIDGNGAVTGDRVFQILSSSFSVKLVGMTIQNGNLLTGNSPTPDGGGIKLAGISLNSPDLLLADLVIKGNSAFNGGGLSAALGNVELFNTRIQDNYGFDIAGGLIVDGSTLSIQQSQVFSNTAGFRGGGLFLSDVNNGLIERDEIYSNTASDDGGGMIIQATRSNPFSQLMLQDSSVHNNHSGSSGGAIENQGPLVISSTIIDSNSASNYGGGIIFIPRFDASTTLIQKSTLSRNSAQSGGAIYSDDLPPSKGSMTLVNSTLSGNSVTHDGGGIYADHVAKINLLNTTIADNQIFRPLSQFYAVHGGGVIITPTAIITAQNSLIGDNFFTNHVSAPTPNDCFGTLHSLGANLIEDLTNCSLSGTLTGNITGQVPRLGPLQANGGATQTQALLTHSPAIDATNNSACPASDQRGVPRPFDGDGNGSAICDIGAYEFAAQVKQTIDFLPIFNRRLTDGPFGIEASTSSGLLVSFSSNTPGVCSVSGSSLFAGFNSATVSMHFRGLCSLTARQAGDVTFDPATPVTQTFTVIPGVFLPLILR